MARNGREHAVGMWLLVDRVGAVLGLETRRCVSGDARVGRVGAAGRVGAVGCGGWSTVCRCGVTRTLDANAPAYGLQRSRVRIRTLPRVALSRTPGR